MGLVCQWVYAVTVLVNIARLFLWGVVPMYTHTISVWEYRFPYTCASSMVFTKLLDFCQSDNVILICIYLVLSSVECFIYLKAFAFLFFLLWIHTFLSWIFLFNCWSFKSWFNKNLYILGRLDLCLWYELPTTLPHLVIHLLTLIMVYLFVWSCRGAF